MSRQYPIWNAVNACIYQSDKSYGARDTSTTTVFVGTSASNSEFMVEHVTTRRIEGAYTVFRFGVRTVQGGPLVVLKTKWMHTKNQTWFDDEPAELRAEERDELTKLINKVLNREPVS